MKRALALTWLLSGCTLIDQNTFNPHAGDIPVVQSVPVVAASPAPDPNALLSILVAGDTLSASDRANVRRAVRSVRARNAAVRFDVTAILPPDATATGPGAPSVARAIIAEGVPASRVRLAARPEPGATGQETRVYVQ